MSSTDLLHQPERRNRSEIHLTTTLEHSEQEHGRSQTPNPQSNRRSLVGRAKDRAKDLFKPKALRSHDSSGRRSAVNPREDVDSFRTDKDAIANSEGMIKQSSNSLPLEDKIQSSAGAIKRSSHVETAEGHSGVSLLQADMPKETPLDQFKAPDLVTVDAARDAANEGISKMKGLAAPVQSVASPISNADNSIDFVDSISPFLDTLSKFNSVVDKIATIHPYAQAAWTILSFASKTIIDQKIRDDSILSLLQKMDSVYTFLTEQELREIESMKTVVEQICHQTLECSYFIREYSQNKKFRMRLLKNLFSEMDARVQKYNSVFDELLQKFHDRAAGDTLVVVHRIWENMNALAHDSDLNNMPYVGGAGLDTQKLCLEGTRKEILDDITDWINNSEDHTSRIFWLHGNAGTGKSSIAHTIADRFNKLERLGSCYCFDRSKIAEERHKKIFATIAQDLADNDEQIRRELAAAVHLDKSLRNTTDILQQWKELIMKPADKLSEAMVGPIVIVIDALDESGGADSRQYLLRILAGTLNDDQSHISKLPSHVRILLTSRALPDIYNALNGVEHVQSKSMDTIPSTSTERDIFNYVSDELKGIQIEGVLTRLASASGGLFEWARLACAYVKGDNVAGSDVKERFEDVITHDQDEPVMLLDNMYKLTLESVFPPNQHKRSRSLDQFRSVMAQILGIAEPLSLDALGSMRSHFIEDCFRETDVSVIVKPMGALLSGTTNPSAMIRPLHASFPEFLTDKRRSGEFFIDLSQIHNDLVAASLGVMKDKLEFNICRLPSSYLANSEVPGFDLLVKKCISLELSYSCRFWTDHLRLAQFNVVLADMIRGLFNHEQLLFWIEILSLLKIINTCAASMSSVIQWVMFEADCKDISDNAADVQRFVRMFGGPISFSTPHLYLSALPFSPQNSHIHAKFVSKFKVPQIVEGGNMNWPAIQGVLHGHSELVTCIAFSPDGKHIVSGSEDRTVRLWDAETGELVRLPLQGHERWVLSVAFSPDGKHIVSGSADNTIWLWDAETGELVQPPLQGHVGSVRSVAFSPDGKYIVSGSEDKTIRLWNAKTGELVQPPLQGHKNWVWSVVFSPDSKHIVSGSSDKTIRLWNTETGKLVQPPLQGHESLVQSVAFSPDGKHIVSGSEDKTIRLWDAETGELVQPPLQGHEDGVWSVAFSPDGKHIVSGSEDKTIRLWNAKTGELVQSSLQGHEDWVLSVAFSPDGKRIVSGSSDKTIRLWDAETGELVQPPLQGHKGRVRSVAFSPDDKHIVSGSEDKTIQLWDAETGELVQPALQKHEDRVWSVAFSPDIKDIVSESSDKTISLWDVKIGELVQPSLQGHEDSVMSVAFSPDGKYIVSGSEDKTIRLWNAKTGELVQPPMQGHEDWVWSVAFSPDGKHIVSGSEDKTIRLWDAETGELVQPPLQGHKDRVWSVAFSPDGKHIVSGSEDKTIQLWDAKTGKVVQPPLQGHEDWVWSVAFSPDGKHIVSGSEDKTIRLWDAETRELVQPPMQGHENRVWSVAFSPDGKHIVSGSEDKTIRLWDAGTRELMQPPMQEHENRVWSVAFSPGIKDIVSESSDKTIQFWDAKTGKLVQPSLQGHEDSVMSVAFSPDGKHIVSGSKDKTIRLWDAKTGELVQPPMQGHEDWVLSVAFSPDGKHIVSGSKDKTIRLWDAKTGELVQPHLMIQNLIRFSSNLKHALTITTEIASDMLGHSLVDFVKLTTLGWVHVGSEHKLLFWTPPTYHLQWYSSPTMQVIIPIPTVQLDLSQMAHGQSWGLCYLQGSA